MHAPVLKGWQLEPAGQVPPHCGNGLLGQAMGTQVQPTVVPFC